MTRILNLQAMTSYAPSEDMVAESTSSGNGCACSSHSAAVCFMGDEVVAI